MEKIGPYKNGGKVAELKLAATMRCLFAEAGTHTDLRLTTQNGTGMGNECVLRLSSQNKMSGGGMVKRYRDEGRK